MKEQPILMLLDEAAISTAIAAKIAKITEDPRRSLIVSMIARNLLEAKITLQKEGDSSGKGVVCEVVGRHLHDMLDRLSSRAQWDILTSGLSETNTKRILRLKEQLRQAADAL